MRLPMRTIHKNKKKEKTSKLWTKMTLSYTTSIPFGVLMKLPISDFPLSSSQMRFHSIECAKKTRRKNKNRSKMRCDHQATSESHSFWCDICHKQIQTNTASRYTFAVWIRLLFGLQYEPSHVHARLHGCMTIADSKQWSNYVEKCISLALPIDALCQ